MYGIETIHSLNAKAEQAAYIMNKYIYLETLTTDQQLAFKQLGEGMQQHLVRQHLQNRKEQDLQTR